MGPLSPAPIGEGGGEEEGMRAEGFRELWPAEGNESFHLFSLAGWGLGFSKESLFSEKTCLVLSSVRVSILYISLCLSLLPPLSLC